MLSLNLQNRKTTLQSVDKAPLTLAQDFLWQAYSAFDFSPIYNLPFAVEFLEEINEDVFFQAFTDIVERHAGLRTILIAPMVKPINRLFLHLNLNNSNGFGTVPKVTMQRLPVKLHINLI